MIKVEPLKKGDCVDGRYRILKMLGEGGLAFNYLSVPLKGKRRKYVLKQTRRKVAITDRISDDRFQVEREFRVLQQLNHPSIPKAYDMFEREGVLYFTREFRDGQILEDLIEKGLSNNQVCKISYRLIRILQYLHEKGIVYRDLKPSNILVDEKKDVFMFDFGTCRYYKKGKEHDTIPLGTPGFAAPEQYGKTQTDARADIYSFGALLYYMLTGDSPENRPFKIGDAENISKYSIKEGLQKVLYKCLRLNPDERYQNVGELARELFSEDALTEELEDPSDVGLLKGEFSIKPMIAFLWATVFAAPFALLTGHILASYLPRVVSLNMATFLTLFITMFTFAIMVIILFPVFTVHYEIGVDGFAVKRLFMRDEHSWRKVDGIDFDARDLTGVNMIAVHLKEGKRVKFLVNEKEKLVEMIKKHSGVEVE